MRRNHLEHLMDSTHPLVITGKSGAGKTHLLKQAIAQGMKSFIVDGRTHEGALELPNPLHFSSIVFDHVCFLKNGPAVIAQAYAWCNDSGSELILVDQILSEVLALLPAHTPDVMNVNLTKLGSERIVEINAHGKSKTVPYDDWARAMKRILGNDAPAAAGPGQ